MDTLVKLEFKPAGFLVALADDYIESQGWGKVSPFEHPFGAGSTVYLSGPMSGMDNHNRESFWLAELALNRLGLATLSPAHWLTCQDYEWYMRADFEMVLKSNAVFALKGYKDSVGATAEITVARSLNYTIIEEI